MEPAELDPVDASAKWRRSGAGEHYRDRRFATRAARDRDLRIVEAMLESHLRAPAKRLLDVPCGSGRLSAALARRAGLYVGADASRDMLEVARNGLADHAGRWSLLEARGETLPLPDRAFEVVVACRWLHHLRDAAHARAAVAELARVSSDLVIVSFWDARSLPQWRRSVGLKRDEGPRGRGAIHRKDLQDAFEAVGARVLEWRASLRFVSQQTFAIARVGPHRP